MSPGGIRVGLWVPKDRCRTLQVGHRLPGPLVVGSAEAGFRVVSASHTTSGRKFRSHRSDLRAPPRLIEDQVERTVLGILVVGTSFCVGGAHSTCEEELWAHNPHAVWVSNGCNDVEISTLVANVVRIWEDSGQTVL